MNDRLVSVSVVELRRALWYLNCWRRELREADALPAGFASVHLDKERSICYNNGVLDMGDVT